MKMEVILACWKVLGWIYKFFPRKEELEVVVVVVWEDLKTMLMVVEESQTQQSLQSHPPQLWYCLTVVD